MASIQQLRDQRAAAWAQAQEFNSRNDRGDDMSGEDETAWARALADVDRLGTEIENRETTAALSSRFGEIDDQARAEGAAAATGQPAQASDADTYRTTFMKYLALGPQALNPDEAALMAANFGQIQNAQGVSTGSAGGYTVPEGFWRKVTETMKYFGGATIGAEVITTQTGAPLPWPTNDDTANEGYFIGENTALTSEGDLSFGQKTLGAHILASGPTKASIPYLQDTELGGEDFIARKVGERLGRRANRAYTVGAGTTEPIGYVTGTTTGKTTASATAITWDELIDLEHSVDAAYRGTGRCRYKFHDLVLNYLRKVKDNDGKYIWQPSTQAGVPDRINNHPYDINNNMDSTIVATKNPVAFGDFQSAFVVRAVAGGQMIRLGERYADSLQVGFIGFQRIDSLVQDASAVKLLTQHA